MTPDRTRVTCSGDESCDNECAHEARRRGCVANLETLRVLGFDVIPAAVGVETSIATANASTARWNTRRITNAFWRVPVFRNDA
jgi:hypothetical protein